MAKNELWVLYWLRAISHTKPIEHGYIGVCLRRRISLRIYKHRWTNETHKRFTPDFEWEILFEGSETECLKLERKLRPEIKIGWNLAAGGEEGRGSGSKGVPKSPEQREKMRAAALTRYAKPGEKERTSKAVKKGLRGIDRSGANNPNFGKTTSEEAKQKMRDKIEQRGGILGTNNPNYRHGRDRR